MATKRRGRRAAGSSGSTLSAVLAALAETFTASVLTAIRSVTLGDLAAASHRARATTTRRTRSTVSPTTANIAKQSTIPTTIRAILTVLRDSPEGLTADELIKRMGLKKESAAKAIAIGLTEGHVRKTGRTRGTRYFPAV